MYHLKSDKKYQNLLKNKTDFSEQKSYKMEITIHWKLIQKKINKNNVICFIFYVMCYNNIDKIKKGFIYFHQKNINAVNKINKIKVFVSCTFLFCIHLVWAQLKGPWGECWEPKKRQRFINIYSFNRHNRQWCWTQCHQRKSLIICKLLTIEIV